MLLKLKWTPSLNMIVDLKIIGIQENDVDLLSEDGLLIMDEHFILYVFNKIITKLPPFLEMLYTCMKRKQQFHSLIIK